MGYRAYIRVVAADDGRPLGKTGLAPVAANLQAHIDEAFAEVVRQGYRGGRASVWIASHLGHPVIRFEAGEAWEVRVAFRVIRDFLKRTGWKVRYDINANTAKAGA